MYQTPTSSPVRLLETIEALQKCASDLHLKKLEGPTESMYQDWWEKQFIAEKDYPNSRQITQWCYCWPLALHDAGFKFYQGQSIEPLYEQLDMERRNEQMRQAYELKQKQKAELDAKIARGELKKYEIVYEIEFSGSKTVYAPSVEDAEHMVMDMGHEDLMKDASIHSYGVYSSKEKSS